MKTTTELEELKECLFRTSFLGLMDEYKSFNPLTRDGLHVEYDFEAMEEVVTIHKSPRFESSVFPIFTTFNLAFNEIDGIDLPLAARSSFSVGIASDYIKTEIDESMEQHVLSSTDILERLSNLVLLKETILLLSNQGNLSPATLNAIGEEIGGFEPIPPTRFLYEHIEENPEMIDNFIRQKVKRISRLANGDGNQDSSRVNPRIYIPCIDTFIRNTLYYIALHGKAINRCKLCGKLFIPKSRTDELYCMFPNTDYNGKECRMAHIDIDRKRRIADKGISEINQLNKRIYNRLRKRSESECLDYQTVRDEMKRLYPDLSDGKYLEWLRRMDEKTRIR